MNEYVSGYNGHGEFVSLPRYGGLAGSDVVELEYLSENLGVVRYCILWWLFYNGRWLYGCMCRLFLGKGRRRELRVRV